MSRRPRVDLGATTVESAGVPADDQGTTAGAPDTDTGFRAAMDRWAESAGTGGMNGGRSVHSQTLSRRQHHPSQPVMGGASPDGEAVGRSVRVIESRGHPLGLPDDNQLLGDGDCRNGGQRATAGLSGRCSPVAAASPDTRRHLNEASSLKLCLSSNVPSIPAFRVRGGCGTVGQSREHSPCPLPHDQELLVAQVLIHRASHPVPIRTQRRNYCNVGKRLWRHRRRQSHGGRGRVRRGVLRPLIDRGDHRHGRRNVPPTVPPAHID